ncbi:TauD/TfdA family dioxygenase [Amycolatopsis cynarae]|uniref:TauD/TfdA family dioxygenase n=1 Tax=Amycolatopsis cynarae TaxID=2995223 RepID=A0ABY7ATV8_9PSEU|nr:TauD/TfdA family dioxygenase [Amycolatopsis sp. HUAS 11-8]WAL62958.1 TauD/TfdA family dioxygenase [Amycolatopsis sp. HUAS 11-8]
MPLSATEMPSYPLTVEERRAFHRPAADLACRFDSAPQDTAIAVEGVPAGLAAFVSRFAEDSGRRGFAVIRGIPIDALPPTPDSYTTGFLTEHSTSGFLLLVAGLLGSPVGYADEKGGTLIHEVHPVRGEETRIENTGARNLGFHTENAHHPLRPDFLGLLCLRQDRAGLGASRLSSVREAAEGLSAETIAILRSPVFHSLYPTSFTRGSAGERPSSPPHPVISGEDDGLLMRFDAHNTYSYDSRGKAALRELSAALDASCREIMLEPGDLILIDNHVAAHGRSAFTPRYDGNNRWLRRFYSLRTVPAWIRDHMPAPRVLPSVSEVTRLARA